MLRTYVRAYVRTYVPYFFPYLRPAKAISQAGYAAKGTSQDTYVRTWRVHRWRLRIMSCAVVSWDPPFIGLPDDDDERRRRRQRGAGAGVRPEDSCVRAHVAHVPTPVRTRAYFARLGTCVRAICAAQCFLYVRTYDVGGHCHSVPTQLLRTSVHDTYVRTHSFLCP